MLIYEGTFTVSLTVLKNLSITFSRKEVNDGKRNIQEKTRQKGKVV